MTSSKMAELLTLLAVLRSANGNVNTDPSAKRSDGSVDSLAALVGLGQLLTDGMKERDALKDPAGNVPNLAKEFHKMGMGVKMIEYALDVGLANQLDLEQLTNADKHLKGLLNNLTTLQTNLSSKLAKASLEHRRAKGHLAVGDFFYTDETGDEIQQLTDESKKDFFYNLGFTHATDAQIAAHLAEQPKS